MIKYPVYKPSLGGNEKLYVNEALDSSWISGKGVFIDRFEQMLADYIGVSSATSCTNGTVALHLAMLTLEIGIDDEVIVPSFTYIASANAARYVGAITVFIDSLADSLQLDHTKIEAAITPKTKAIIVPHLYGNVADMNQIMSIANKYNLFVIEDTAEALGSKYCGKPAGSFGHVSTFSFFGNKTVTTGEGGMLASNDPEIINRAIYYKNQGLESLNPAGNSKKEYWHDVVGYNYRMTNITAAIGVAQMEKIEQIIAKKRQIQKHYADCLQSTRDLFILNENESTFSSYWMVCLMCATKEIRDGLRAELLSKGVETRPLFPCIHEMPPYFNPNSDNNFPVGQKISETGMNLPSYPELEFSDIEEICKIISDFISKTP